MVLSLQHAIRLHSPVAGLTIQQAVRFSRTTKLKDGTQGGVSISLTVAVVGATGAVGNEFLRLFEERNFPLANFKTVG